MPEIGTLADGIAHDFNNLFMGIQGYISLMLAQRHSDALAMDVKEGDSVRIMITDNGAGMDKETCQRVFDPFFSSDAKTIIAGTETILLVDDETSIVDVCGEMLTTLGYNILPANNGRDALKIYEINKGAIDLVILDMIMPGLSGGETFDALQLMDPKVKVMLSTGYIISDQVKKIMGKGCQGIIQKPFRMEELSRKIREILDRNK
jgi:CheY-like chemotaxis protein